MMLPDEVEVYLYTDITDMRKSINSMRSGNYVLMLAVWFASAIFSLQLNGSKSM